MAEVPYSNRELDSKFDDIHAKLDEIIKQTKETNGKVRSLQLWRAAIMGGLMVLGAANVSNFALIAQAIVQAAK